MDQPILTLIVAVVLTAVMQIPIARVCRKNPAIGAWKPVIIAISLLWGVFFFIRVYYLADPGAREDSLQHEAAAREVAQYFRGGDFESAFAMSGVGNTGFRFVVGVIYAFTGIPQIALICLFTLMAFSGLLTLLDVAVRSVPNSRLPFWIVVIICAYPEALIWSTDLLKEGPLLWGMCTTLRFVVPDPTKRGMRRWIAPILGSTVFMFLRPHIAFAWLLSIAIAVTIKQRRWGFALLITACVGVSVLGMLVLAPRLFTVIAQRGLVDTFEQQFLRNVHDTGGSTLREEGAPIPVVSGLVMLFLRPFPWEAPHAVGVLAGLEFWLYTLIMLFSWLTLPNRGKFATTPIMLTAIVVTLFLAFFFSYMFNLGLMVRQRIQFYPAMIILLATPVLARRALAVRMPRRRFVYQHRPRQLAPRPAIQRIPGSVPRSV